MFAHGGVLRCAAVYFKGIALENAFDFDVAYGQLVAYEV
ncbi:MAG: hypothetical protein ACRC8J_01545 [Phocaeicola sp.]